MMRSGLRLLGGLALLLALLLTGTCPLRYALDIGVAEGYGGDVPFVRGFHAAEQNEHGPYRWTDEGATVSLPGVGQRPLLLRMRFLPLDAPVAAVGPRSFAVRVGGEEGEVLAVLPVRREGASSHLLVPARLLRGGTLTLSFHTETFTVPGDPRPLGSPLAHLAIESLDGRSSPFPPFPLFPPFPTAPDWGAVGGWLLAVLLFRLVVGSALGGVGASGHARGQSSPFPWADGLTGMVALLVVLASWLDPPRWAMGATPTLITLVWCGVLVWLLRPALTALARRLALPVTPRTMNWLLLLVVAGFGLRYGGRIYPQSMPGDILFHTHRFVEAIGQGDIFLKAPHRGAVLPYPPGAYLVAAPLALLVPDPPRFFEFGAALVDGLSAVLVAALVIGAAGRHYGGSRSHPQTMALLAAAIYVFAPAGFMATWWSFDTHILTQFAALLLMTTLVLVLAPSVSNGERGRKGEGEGAGWGPACGVIALFTALVLLGHSGFFVNTVLLGGVLLLVLWLAAWRGYAWARAARWPLTLAFGVPLLGTFLIFSSAYLPMMIAQARTAVAEGLPEMTRQAPVPRGVLWHTLWHDGVVRHFGGFPLLLVPAGWWTLLDGRQAAGNRPGSEGRRVLATLMAGTLLVSSFFAVLPFVTRSSQSTRWLMFSAWVVAVGAARSGRWFWRYGWAGRVVVAAMGGFVLWMSATFWLGPLAWRIRPPEPF